mmetsp:Transcript_33534/g.88525  ORF Transcript_33534/g.88525 Transcript_33534/m.88525 type:complete len:90 (+) Transcript_33534:3-272(+)
MMARIASVCYSTRWSNQSVLGTALQLAGCVQQGQKKDYIVFLICLMQRAARFEIYPVGKVTGRMVFACVRLFAIAIPALIGVVSLQSRT